MTLRNFSSTKVPTFVQETPMDGLLCMKLLEVVIRFCSRKQEDSFYFIDVIYSPGQRDAAQLLIDRGADVNSKNDNLGSTPIHEAAYYGNFVY